VKKALPALSLRGFGCIDDGYKVMERTTDTKSWNGYKVMERTTDTKSWRRRIQSHADDGYKVMERTREEL